MDAIKHAVLIGLLLGDCHLQKTESSSSKCRMRIAHGLEQKEYTDWIHQLFLEWCQKTKTPFQVQNKKGYYEYQFYSEYREELIDYHNHFYKELPKTIPGKRFIKQLPENIDQFLIDPTTLAVWFMDDGTKRTDCNAGRIATQGFTKKEQIQLKYCLWKNFSIFVQIDTWHDKKGKELYGLSIPSTGGHFKRWCDLIRPFINQNVPTMKYKLQLEDPETP